MVSWPGPAGGRLACSFGLSERVLRGPSVRMSLRNWGRLPQKDEKGLGDKHGFESPSGRLATRIMSRYARQGSPILLRGPVCRRSVVEMRDTERRTEWRKRKPHLGQPGGNAPRFYFRAGSQLGHKLARMRGNTGHQQPARGL